MHNVASYHYFGHGRTANTELGTHIWQALAEKYDIAPSKQQLIELGKPTKLTEAFDVDEYFKIGQSASKKVDAPEKVEQKKAE
jgi:hypothetical protein